MNRAEDRKKRILWMLKHEELWQHVVLPEPSFLLYTQQPKLWRSIGRQLWDAGLYSRATSFEAMSIDSLIRDARKFKPFLTQDGELTQ